jgi:hypothetical protein
MEVIVVRLLLQRYIKFDVRICQLRDVRARACASEDRCTHSSTLSEKGYSVGELK